MLPLIMAIVSTSLSILGGLCLFLYGMKVMSDGVQEGAGDKLQRALNYMTINRFAGVVTGFVVTGIIQSSQAVTVMLVSFVNAGLLTLTQSIGVIMGANIGTTVTAWIVSLVGFSFKLSELALPAIGIGFIFGIMKWKYRNLGTVIMGFGLLFMGLDFMTKAMPEIGNAFDVISSVSDLGFLSNLIGMGAGLVMTLIIHSSSASTAIILTMTYNGLVGYEMAAAMILGANVGTTVDAALAAIGTRTTARRTALVHILFNVIGTCWALPLLKPLLALVDLVCPGTMTPGMAFDPQIPVHLAMLHTVFNAINTLLFLPFVNPFARLVSWLIKDNGVEAAAPKQYHLEYRARPIRDTPELNILRAEKEVRDMAGLTSGMFGEFRSALDSMRETALTEDSVKTLTRNFREKEGYADQMREGISSFLIECTRQKLNRRTEQRVSRLLRIVADLEEMTDDCFSISLIMERSVLTSHVFKGKEVQALIPYVGMVAGFLDFLRNNLGGVLSEEQILWAEETENKIDASRDRLRKLGRKRIEAGKNVKTELLFIDLVRRIEKLGDYCYDIAESLTPVKVRLRAAANITGPAEKKDAAAGINRIRRYKPNSPV